jgi:hypothetical protein
MFPYLTNKTIIVGKAEEETLSSNAVIGNTTINVDLVSSIASADLTKRSEYVIRDLDGEEKITISGVSGGASAVYLESAITRNYSVNRKAAILVPGVLCTPLAADFDTRLYNLTVAPVQEQDNASMKYANGDYGRAESTQGARTVEISFSEKLAVKKSVGTGAKVEITGITGSAGSIKTISANPPSGQSGSGYVPGDLLQVAVGTNGLVRVLTVGSAGNVLTYDTTIVNGGSGSYAITGAAATTPVYDIPNYSKFLKAAGHTVKWYNWGAGVGFQSLAKADEDTLSFAVYQIQGGAAPKAKKWLFTGCKCSSFDVGCEGLGKPYIANYKFTGKFLSVTTDDPIALSSCETGKAEKMLCNKIYTYDPITSATVNLAVSTFKLDAGLKTVGIPDPSDCYSGSAFYIITDRDPKFTCDPLAKSLTDEAMETNINNVELVAVTVKSASTLPNITIEMPTCQLGTAEYADKDGQISNNRTYQCLRNNQGAGSHNTSLPAECPYEILIGSRT